MYNYTPPDIIELPDLIGRSKVHYTLLVGIRPYLSMLLSHDDPDASPEVAGLALSLWTKILVFDTGKDGLPGKDTCRCFLRLVQSESLASCHRAFACLCLAVTCHGRESAQALCLQLGVLEAVVKVLSTSRHPTLRWMAALMCAEACHGCAKVAQRALQGRTAEVLLAALEDPAPEVRASAAYAIGSILAALPPTPEQCDELETDVVSDAASDATVSVGPGAGLVQLQGDGRWQWLAQSTMLRFSREPVVDMIPSNETSSGSPHGTPMMQAVAPEGTVLNEASVLVRYELACAMVPWLGDGCLTHGLPHLGSLPPACEPEPLDQGDEAASMSSISSCPSTPTLNPLRSPHLRPNSSFGSAPVTSAHQAERRFMNLLSQDPALQVLAGDSGWPPVSRAAALHGLLEKPCIGSSFLDARMEPLNKVVSDSCFSRLYKGAGTEDLKPPSASPIPESVIYSWTMTYLQQAGSMGALLAQSTQGAMHREDVADIGVLDLTRPELCCDLPNAGSTCTGLSIPSCPWGILPPASSDQSTKKRLARCDCCRPISLPDKPCPPMLFPGMDCGLVTSAGGAIRTAQTAQSSYIAVERSGQHLAEAHDGCESAFRNPPSLTVDVDLSLVVKGEELRISEYRESNSIGTPCFHPHLPLCAVGGRGGRLAVVSYETGLQDPLVCNFNLHDLERVAPQRPPPTTRDENLYAGGRTDHPELTQLTMINAHNNPYGDPHHSLLCCATDAGSVHICRCWACECHEPVLATAFQAMPRRQNASLCTHWQQNRCQLVAAGRDAHIRVWDLCQEQLVCCLRHGNGHCVTCVSQGDDSVGFASSGLTYVGRSDGSLVGFDLRTSPGSVLCHKGSLETVTTITPGVQTSCGENLGSHLVAATDARGVVELWDIRLQQPYASYQIGCCTASTDLSSTRPWERVHTLCHSPALGSMIASVRLHSNQPEVMSLTDIVSGVERLGCPLRVNLHPSAMGFHPTRFAFGVVADSHLLLYT